MQFVFKRDEEGRERIYVGDVCVAEMVEWPSDSVTCWRSSGWVHGLEPWHMQSAIERADAAGFWAMRDARSFGDIVALLETGVDAWLNDEVTVDVPVADNAVLSVTVGGDES